MAEWKSSIRVRHSTSAETRMWGKQPTAMLTIYTGKGVIPEVNLTEWILCMPPPSANKATHSGFETQKRHHQKSEIRLSVAPKFGMCTTKIFKNKFFV